MRSAAVLLTSVLAVSVASAASKADLNARSLDGQKVHLKDLRGKLVVLNFWATWCGPCRDELPMLVKTAQGKCNPDLVFIAVSVDDSKTQGQGFRIRCGSSASRFRYGSARMEMTSTSSRKARRFRRRFSSIATELLRPGCRERSARAN